MIGAVVGSSLGSYVPVLWGGDLLSLTSCLLALIGGFLGIWAGYRLGQSFL